MYPFIETTKVWDFEVKQYVASFRSEDWYGMRGYLRQSGGDVTLARKLKNEWNPALRNLIQTGDTVIDCGANEGYTTVLFAKQVGPTGRVIAIEANIDNIPILEQNIALNGLKNVFVVHKAVGEKSGDYVSFKHEMVQEGKADNCVETICLDDFAGDRPAMLKIDIEGYELPALLGARKLLERGVRMEVEMHLSEGTGVHMTRAFGFDPHAIIALLDEYKYDLTYDGKPLDRNRLREGCMYCVPKS